MRLLKCAFILTLLFTLILPTRVVTANPEYITDYYPLPYSTYMYKVDNEGNPWFARWISWPQREFVKLDASTGQIRTYSITNGIYPASDSAFDFDSEGNIWYADFNYSDRSFNITKFNPGNGTFENHSFGIASDWEYPLWVNNVLVDKNGIIWIVNNNPTGDDPRRCLFEFNPQTEELNYYIVPLQGNIERHEFDREGNIWITGLSSTLFRFDVETHEYETHDLQLPYVGGNSPHISAMGFDSAGDIWLLIYIYNVPISLLKYYPDTGDIQEYNLELGTGWNQALVVDDEDVAWVGDKLNKRIIRFDGNSILSSFDQDGYEIRYLRVTSSGDIWASEYLSSQSEYRFARFSQFKQISATIDFDPDTLNLKSKGEWVTAYIELTENYDVVDIDVSTIKLNGTVAAEAKPTEVGDYDEDSIPDLMVKFERASIQDILDVGDAVEIIITGELADGTSFEGKDTIRVIGKGKE